MTLFKRIIGLDESDKIGIHLVNGCVSEVANGRLTVDQAVDILELNESEAQDLIRVLTCVSTVSDKIATSNRIFNYLCLGELGVNKHRDYTNEDLFWQMVEAE